MPKPNRTTLKSIEKMIDQMDDDMILSLLGSNAEDDDTEILQQQLQQKIAQEMNDHSEFEKVQAEMQNTILNLADYLNAAQMVINETFAHSVWVKAEIRSLSSKGGHYYFELADKDELGKITASCRGNLWRNNAPSVIKRFEQSTGMTLDKGLTVLLKVTANFHPQYGFSVTILDIDPTFTLGDLAKQYELMLTKLMEEGLLGLNKSLPMPFDIKNVLVIAPENAAGLGDFRADADRLHNNDACHFYYQHATFQGNHAPNTIRQAIFDGLKQLSTQAITPDIVVIIRGGGAVGDLAYLNDYELGAVIAELPYPVWVGIGHERDRVLLDEVAHSSFDTPSKVIVAIREHLVTVMQQAKSAFLTIEKLSKQQLKFANHQAEQAFRAVEHLAKQQLILTKQQLDNQLTLLKNNSFAQLQSAKSQTNQLRTLILLQNPKNVLAKGYAIVRQYSPNHDGEVITKVEQIISSQALIVEMQDGYFEAKVMNVETK